MVIRGRIGNTKVNTKRYPKNSSIISFAFKLPNFDPLSIV